MEALEIALDIQAATNIGVKVLSYVSKNGNRGTVSIVPAKRPFPIQKFRALHHAVGGTFFYQPTTCQFVKAEQRIKKQKKIDLVINIYFDKCLDPNANFEVKRGFRSRGDIAKCNHVESVLAQGLGIKEATQTILAKEEA